MLKYKPAWHNSLLYIALLLVLVFTSFIQPGSASRAAAEPAPVAPSGLHVVGNQLVDGWGQPLRLLGVNRSGTEYACAQGWGFFDGPSDAASVQAIASWRANAVRVPLNESCWLGINGVSAAYGGANYQAAIRNYVDLLTQQGLVPILELHWSAAGNVRALKQQPMPDRDHSPAFWSQVAASFKDNTSVIFDLFNEPYPEYNFNTAEAWRCWRDGGTCRGVAYQAAGMQELVSAVRGTGAQNVIMLGGVQYANALSGWLANRPFDPTGNLVASWHVYNFNICNTLACFDRTVAPVSQQVPLVAGEIGENTCSHTFIDKVMSWLDARGAGYLGWTWDNWGGCRPVLITDYNGTPTAMGVGFRDHLAAIAAQVPPAPVAPAPLSYSPAPPSAPLGALTLYENGLQNGFTDGSFGLLAHNPCDPTASAPGSCGYTVSYGPWGGVNLMAGSNGIDTSPYSTLELEMRTNDLPIGSFSVLLTDNTAVRAVVREIVLSPDNVKATLPGGWLQVAVPVAVLNPANVPVSSIQVKNATAAPLASVTIYSVRLTRP